MKLVRQRMGHDCVVAVLAMLIDLPYEVAQYILEEECGGQPAGRGYLDNQLVDAMRHMGYRVSGERQRSSKGLWPPRPFAPKHAAIVVLPQGKHAVAVDKDGVIYDPGASDGRPAWFCGDGLPLLQSLRLNRVRKVIGFESSLLEFPVVPPRGSGS